MDVDNNMRVEPEEKRVDEHHGLQLGGNQLLTSRLKTASRSTERIVKANAAQLIGAAVLTGSVAFGLCLFKRRKRHSNKDDQRPSGSPQVPLAWHWENFKQSYMADDDDSCSISCRHLKAVQAVAKKKVAATCQELYRLGVLQFLVDEMQGHSSAPQFLQAQSHGPTWPRRTTAGSKSPSPDRVPRRLNSLQSPARSKPCQGHQSSCSRTAVSPEKAFSSVTRSPTLRVPTVPTDNQAETADRGGALHIPASAPTSSGHSSPRLSARRALSLASPSKQPLGPLPPQSPPNNPAASKHSAGQSRPAKQSAGAFWDENRPIGGLISPDSPRNDEIPAWFQPCGDLNEDVEQWEGQEKEHGPSDDDTSTFYTSEEDETYAARSTRASPSPKPLGSRISGVPPLSGQRSLAPTPMPPRLPATPLRQLQLVSPDRELHSGRIYSDPARHLLMVQVALDLLLTPSGDLDQVYINSLSEVQHLSVIQQHLSSDRNAGMTEALEEWAGDAGEPIMRLLRLTSRHLFDADQYQDRCQIARGAFSEVYTCSCGKEGRAPSQLALKVSDLPSQSRQNEQAQITAFTEIGVMRRLAHMPGICKLHDYGISRHGIYLVMTRYSCSLRTWLAKQTVKPALRLRMYMEIFRQLAELLKAVAEQEVVHFDLKCDNILLEALPGMSQQEFWNPSTDSPPFKVVLADFGDSCDFSLSEQKFTTRSLGTESNQPPEMLVSKECCARKQFGKLPEVNGSSSPSDVWSLGCLLFELFTGNLLYPDSEDFSKFFSMLTGMSDEVLLSPERLQPVEHMPAVVELLGFILVRDPNMRPSAGAVAERVKAILQTI